MIISIYLSNHYIMECYGFSYSAKEILYIKNIFEIQINLKIIFLIFYGNTKSCLRSTCNSLIIREIVHNLWRVLRCNIMLMKKNNVLSANKRSSKLHTAVSVAFSYLRQCRVKTGGRLLLCKVFQRMQQKGEELRDRPIGN